jgi:hypothetical protein
VAGLDPVELGLAGRQLAAQRRHAGGLGHHGLAQLHFALGHRSGGHPELGRQARLGQHHQQLSGHHGGAGAGRRRGHRAGRIGAHDGLVGHPHHGLVDRAPGQRQRAHQQQQRHHRRRRAAQRRVAPAHEAGRLAQVLPSLPKGHHE